MKRERRMFFYIRQTRNEKPIIKKVSRVFRRRQSKTFFLCRGHRSIPLFYYINDIKMDLTKNPGFPISSPLDACDRDLDNLSRTLFTYKRKERGKGIVRNMFVIGCTFACMCVCVRSD